ncbi:MAG: methyl-accepting chemotaxis protein [Bacteroidales bacterium]|jgi:methyl-accepting chemotaxis protein|nr:methyl-accepting chemotaxis protein [Bacteroidales bacterium]
MDIIERVKTRKRQSSILVRISLAVIIFASLLNIFAALGVKYSSQYKLGTYFAGVLGDKIRTAIKIGTADIRMLADYVGTMPDVFPMIGQSLSEGSFDYLKMVFESSNRLMHYQGYVIADMDGNIVQTTYEGYTQEQLEEFQQLLAYIKNDEKHHYRGYFDLLNQGIGVVTAHVYKDQEGNDAAMVVVCQVLLETYDFLQESAETNGMEVSIIRGTEYTASSMSDDESLNPVGETMPTPAFADSVYAGKIMHEVADRGDNKYINVYTPIPDYRNKVIAIHNAALDVTVMVDLITFVLKGVSIGGSLVSIIMLIILILYFKRKLSDPLKNLAEVANRIADGDLRGEVKVVTTKDEVQMLSDSIAHMHRNLTNTISTVVNTSNILQTASKGLSQASQILSDGASRQASSLEEVSSSLEEITGNIHQNTDSAMRTESLMEKADKSVYDIANEATVSMEQTQSISGSIDAINDLVSQTNILSLNASVEAARAGDAGKGFAVVAKEVGRLAEQTRATAEDVSDKAVLSIAGAEKINHLLDDVTPQLHEVAQLVQGISTASKEQGIGIDHINIAIADLNKVTQETAANAEEIAAKATELSDTADQMQNMLSEFKL